MHYLYFLKLLIRVGLDGLSWFDFLAISYLRVSGFITHSAFLASP